ncbi:MAG: dephospho-CoA kinase [Clostridia bacterium]|nr:dephospho-CoA kinase [Clostridia bacterium]
MRIGITGSIACGKSTVAGYLRSLGYRVVDADAVSRELTAENGRALPKVREAFPGCFEADGTLNRKALGAVVFSDPEAKKRLESILHPLILDEIDRQMAEVKDPLVFADIPLLFECGMERQFDEVWTVTLDPSLQMKRLMERDHLTEAEARARIDSQMPQSEKAARADRCISTEGTPEESRKIVDEMLAAVLPPAARRRRRREPAAPATPAVQEEEAVKASPVPVTAPAEASPRPLAKGRVISRKARRAPTPVMVILIGVFLAAVISVSFFSVRAFVQYQAEQRRIAAEAAERARHPLVYENLIQQYSASQQLDPSLVAAVILCESSFDPHAVSRLGARGLMQLMEDTAGWIAHKLGEDTEDYSFDRLFDPETNIRFGTWYLGYLSRRYDGDAKKMVCAYHAGQGNVDAWLKKPEYSTDGVTLTTIPTQDTSQYAGRVLKAREVYEKYYFAPPVPETQSL